MQENKYFDRAVESYLDHLRKKRDWKNLEKRMVECKNMGWSEEKLRKIFQWERRACDLYNQTFDNAMNSIKRMANEITENQFEDLAVWIRENSHSKEVWDKNIVSINDGLPLIKAKVMHLAFMSRSDDSVNIGDIIKSKE